MSCKMFDAKKLELKSHKKSAVREKSEYLYNDRYWVTISRAYGGTTIEFLCTGTGPTADIHGEEIFIEPDQFSKRIAADKLDEYVENAYVLRDLATYVSKHIDDLLAPKTE